MGISASIIPSLLKTLLKVLKTIENKACFRFWIVENSVGIVRTLAVVNF